MLIKVANSLHKAYKSISVVNGLFTTIKRITKTRAKGWISLRNRFLIVNCKCSYCGGSKKLQVHHITPVHVDKSKELDENNLITLCNSNSKCHLNIGHLGKWNNHNINVVEDCKRHRE